MILTKNSVYLAIFPYDKYRHYAAADVVLTLRDASTLTFIFGIACRVGARKRARERWQMRRDVSGY